MCSFHRRLKEHAGEQNSHVVNLGRNIIGNQWLLCKSLLITLDWKRGWQWSWEEGRLGGQRGPDSGLWALCCSVPPCASQEAAASPASAVAGLGRAHSPGKLRVAQKPPPKLRIMLAFPTSSVTARRMESSGNCWLRPAPRGCQLCRLSFLVSGPVMGLSLGAQLWAANNVI